jgi:anaerobic selenocysteine-containing dehydrogenase
MSERTKRLSRRSFLLAASAGGVATAAAIVATKPASTTQASTTGDKRATRGYQASEHVTNYYRTTKV